MLYKEDEAGDKKPLAKGIIEIIGNEELRTTINRSLGALAGFDVKSGRAPPTGLERELQRLLDKMSHEAE